MNKLHGQQMPYEQWPARRRWLWVWSILRKGKSHTEDPLLIPAYKCLIERKRNHDVLSWPREEREGILHFMRERKRAGTWRCYRVRLP